MSLYKVYYLKDGNWLFAFQSTDFLDLSDVVESWKQQGYEIKVFHTFV